MKKILLGSTVLVGAAALFAGAAFAGETPKVTIGGTVDFQAGFVNEDRSAGTGSTDANFRSGAFRTESELSIKIDAKTDAGLGYGGEIVLPVDATQDATALDQTGREYVYLDGAWGRLEGGTNYGAAATLKIDASRIARATGGIDGDWNYFMTPTTGVGIYTPDALLDHGTTAQFGDESSESINKITYYTPRYMGFQAGVSYLFDTSAVDRGRAFAGRGTNNGGEAENVFVGGINYEGKFSDVSVGLAATGEWGNGETAATEDLRTYNLGAKLGYMGFSVAGSYGSWGDSLSGVSNLDDRDYWTLGAAYEYGPFGASVTYMKSTFETAANVENEFDNLSIGVDYKLAPGFTPYAEVSFVSVDPAAVVNDNDATVFIAGTQLAF
jgi:hypothetical protein